MNIRSLSPGLALTELGFGGAPIGNLYDAVTDEEASAAVEAAWDAGVRYFDTAPHYGLGLSERRLGRSLRSYPREAFVVSTKVGRRLEPSDGGAQPDPEGFVVPATHRRVWDFSRAYGVGMNQAAMLARFVRETDMDVAMIAGRFTLLDQSAAEELLPAALERGVGVINAGIFNSGLLADPRPRPDARYDYGPVSPDVLCRTTRMARTCEQFGVDLPTAAAAFAGSHPAVVSVLVGLRTPGQVRELISRWGRAVPGDLWAALGDEGPPVPPVGA